MAIDSSIINDSKENIQKVESTFDLLLAGRVIQDEIGGNKVTKMTMEAVDLTVSKNNGVSASGIRLTLDYYDYTTDKIETATAVIDFDDNLIRKSWLEVAKFFRNDVTDTIDNYGT